VVDALTFAGYHVLEAADGRAVTTRITLDLQ